ncbi:MAG TPA: hypothetical protein ENJ08_12800 [Gammaproteobacteria bacterium]|nr:hypothetical protein [Gammaproteobacteria bacterium]
MTITLKRKHKVWTAQRIAELELLAQDLTSEQLADHFHVTSQGIREICRLYDIKLPVAQRVRTRQLDAQESIALFKLQYQNQPINQLITRNWRHYEQI